MNQLQLKRPLEPVEYTANMHSKAEAYYRGVTSDGTVLYVTTEVFEYNREFFPDTLYDADSWLSSADEESVWLAVACQLCHKEYRPGDGYYEPNEYSYCAECYQWQHSAEERTNTWISPLE